MTTAIEYAKFYASKGWQVFPLKPHEKTPVVKWADVATTDAAQIAAWWQQTPAANVGIATGARSGIVVLDIDAGHGGEESIAALIAQHGALPVTVTAKTGGGGRHILFKHPGIEIHNSAGKLGKGLDIRGDGGYIVAAPSIHPNGNAYAWNERPSQTPLADMPQWIIDLLTTITQLPYQQASAPAPALSVGGIFPQGQRNQSLISLAGTMRRRGLSELAIFNALMAENAAKCFPPLDEKEVRAIASNVMRYEPTAAPMMKAGERVQIEWAFAKAIVDYPESVAEFLWIAPEQFSEQNLCRWWGAVISSKTPMQAAADAGILIDIDKSHSNPLDVDRYAAQIVKYSRLEQKARTALQVARLAEAGDEERADALLNEMAINATRPEAVSVKGAAEVLDELLRSLRDTNQFIKTGVGNLDNLLGGLERKKISVLAARPSVGKTTFAWQVARSASLLGARVLFLSLEVSGVSLWRKAAFGIAEVSAAAVQNGKIPEEILRHIETDIIPQAARMYDGNLYIYDTPPFDMQTLERAVLQAQPDLIVCDHLGYVDFNIENKVDRLGQIMKWAKRLCKRTNTHFMLIHQLNRDLEKRENKEPQLSDLRDSGNVEEDADIVIMPYRPAYHANGPKMRYNETSMFVRKNRDGATGEIGLVMDMLHQWFYRRDEIPANWSNVPMPQ